MLRKGQHRPSQNPLHRALALGSGADARRNPASRTTNENNKCPVILSLSKDLIRASLDRFGLYASYRLAIPSFGLQQGIDKNRKSTVASGQRIETKTPARQLNT